MSKQTKESNSLAFITIPKKWFYSSFFQKHRSAMLIAIWFLEKSTSTYEENGIVISRISCGNVIFAKQIAQELGMSVPGVLAQLKILESNNIVRKTKSIAHGFAYELIGTARYQSKKSKNKQVEGSNTEENSLDFYDETPPENYEDVFEIEPGESKKELGSSKKELGSSHKISRATKKELGSQPYINNNFNKLYNPNSIPSGSKAPSVPYDTFGIESLPSTQEAQTHMPDGMGKSPNSPHPPLWDYPADPINWIFPKDENGFFIGTEEEYRDFVFHFPHLEEKNLVWRKDNPFSPDKPRSEVKKNIERAEKAIQDLMMNRTRKASASSRR